MDKSNISLFKDDGTNVAMPSINTELDEKDNDLISDSIDGAILGDQVKTLLLPETTEIAELNYILDFSKAPPISKIQLLSMYSLLSKGGEVQIYVYNKEKALIALGYGDKYKLERLMPLIKTHVFEDKITIYKNFHIGEKPQVIKSKDVTKMKLNLW